MLDIVLQIKASYFKNANFCNNQDCPIARAIKIQLGATDVSVATYKATVNGMPYALSYVGKDFDDDLIIAKGADFDDSTVRELTLMRVSDIFEFDTTNPHEN